MNFNIWRRKAEKVADRQTDRRIIEPGLHALQNSDNNPVQVIFPVRLCHVNLNQRKVIFRVSRNETSGVCPASSGYCGFFPHLLQFANVVLWTCFHGLVIQ